MTFSFLRSSTIPGNGHGNRIAEIHEKAAHIIYEKGFDAMSMEDLARTLQLTKAGLYYYIGSKQDLLFSIMKYAMDWLEKEVIGPAKEEADALKRLEFIIRRHGRELIEGPQVISILSDEVAALKPRHRRIILAHKRAYLNLVRNALRELKAAKKLHNVDVTVAAFSIFGSLMWLTRWCKPKGRLSTEKVLDEIVKVTLHGLMPD